MWCELQRRADQVRSACARHAGGGCMLRCRPANPVYQVYQVYQVCRATLIFSHTVPLSRFFGTLFQTSGLSLGPPALLPPVGIGAGGGAHGGGAPGAHGGGGAPGAHGGGGSAPGNGGGGAHTGGASGGGAAFPTLLRLGDLRRPGVRPGVPLRDRAGSSSALGVFFAGVHDRRGRFLMATSSSSSSSWLDRGLFSAAGDRVGRRFRMCTTSSLSMVERGEATTALKSRARREGV